MDKGKLETGAFLVLFGIVTILIVSIFLPFLQILALAAVLAILCHGLFQRLTRLFHFAGGESLAAGLLVLAVIIFFITPVFFLGTQIFSEVQALYSASQSGGGGYTQALEHAVEAPVQHLYPAFHFSISAYTANVLSFISHNLGALLSQTLFVLLETSLMLLAFFFFLRDGDKIIAALLDLSPFRREHTDDILKNLGATISSVMRGTLLVALIRWAAFSLGFTFFGVPNAMLWGIVGGIVGAIPGLGTLFVIVPAAAYLYLAGHALSALLFALFGLVVMVVVDNLLTTYFFGRGLQVPPIFVICALLGGIIYFGPIGFILGPLVLSLFLSTLHMYKILLLKK